VAGSVVSLGLSLASVAAVAGAVVIALNAILGAVIALGGALVALVASAAAAAAGLGALAIAFGAILGPVVLVGIALVQRFTAVLQARKAHEQEVTAAIQQQKTAEDQRKQALDQVKQSTQALGQATVDARHAMAQAAIDQHNAELALADSQLGLKGARLGVLDAKKALRDLLTKAGVTGQALDHLFKQFSDVHVDPTKLQGLLGGVTAAGGDAKKVDPLALAHAILNVQLAQQGVKDAINQTANAERALGTATKRRADFARRGLNAYAPYRAALQRVTQAEDKLRTAQDKVSRAQVVYDRKLKALSQTERGFLGQLNPFIAKLKDLAKAVSAPIFRGLESAMGSLTRLFSNAGIQQSLTAIGSALGNFFATLGHELASRDWAAAFTAFGNAAARMIGTSGRGFISLLRILREIALTALPAVGRAAAGVSGLLGRIAGQPGRIRSATAGVVHEFGIWARLAGAVANLVIAIFVRGAHFGGQLAQHMTEIVRNWTRWVHDNPDRVDAFFRTSVRRAREIVHWLIEAFKWLKNHLPAAAETASNSFGKVLTAVDNIYKKLKGVTELLRGDLSSAAQDLDFGQHLGNPPKGGKGSFFKRFLQRASAGQSGGVVPGIGRGDIMPAMLEPGEFVIRRAVAQSIGLPALQTLNGGGTVTQPTLMPGAGDVHHHYHVPRPAGGGNPDPRSTLEHIHRLIQRSRGNPCLSQSQTAPSASRRFIRGRRRRGSSRAGSPPSRSTTAPR
jgi:hypothetical protein